MSVGFSRQEYWSGLPCPPPGDLPDPGVSPQPLTSPTLADRFFTTSATWEAGTRGEVGPTQITCLSLQDGPAREVFLGGGAQPVLQTHPACREALHRGTRRGTSLGLG